jgi:hypothetical protein
MPSSVKNSYAKKTSKRLNILPLIKNAFDLIVYFIPFHQSYRIMNNLDGINNEAFFMLREFYVGSINNIFIV